MSKEATKRNNLPGPRLLKKEEPPVPVPRGRHTGTWADVAEELRKQPGTWWRVAEGRKSKTAAALRRGAVGGIQTSEFDIVEKAVPTSQGARYTVWMRYTGPSA